ncbi:MAG: hypothetical protein ABEL76_09775 [Bradymonadaceae bacterium]
MRGSRAKVVMGVGLSVALSTASIGCVDQEMSLNLRGVFNYQGQLNETQVQCGDGGGGNNGGGGGGGGNQGRSVTKPVVSCQSDVSASGVQKFLSRASVNIQTVKQQGQVGEPLQPLSEVDICAKDVDRAKFIKEKYRHNSFQLVLNLRNQLNDSRRVGSQGQGGGTGGFEGLRLDANTVQLNKLKIKFPNAPADAVEKTIDIGRMVESGGGGVVQEFIMFRREELQTAADQPGLAQVHRSLVLNRTALQEYNTRARKTTVTMSAEIWLEGKTLGGRSVESNRLTFPVDVCNARGACPLTAQCEVTETTGGGGG